jgi:hypothetical protein
MVEVPHSSFPCVFTAQRNTNTPLTGAATSPAPTQAGTSTTEETPTAGTAREGRQPAAMAAAAADLQCFDGISMFDSTRSEDMGMNEHTDGRGEANLALR